MSKDHQRGNKYKYKNILPQVTKFCTILMKFKMFSFLL